MFWLLVDLWLLFTYPTQKLLFKQFLLTVNINTLDHACTTWNYYNPIVSGLTFGGTVLHFNYKRWINYLHLFPQLLFHYKQCPRNCNALASNLKVWLFLLVLLSYKSKWSFLWILWYFTFSQLLQWFRDVCQHTDVYLKRCKLSINTARTKIKVAINYK